MPGKCGRCGQEVFAAEERLALSTRFHVRCFTCAICSRTLDSYNLAENRELNEIFCKTCYRLNFATKGYGYGGNEPTLLALPNSTTNPPPPPPGPLSTSSSTEPPQSSLTQYKTILDDTKFNQIPPPPPPPPFPSFSPAPWNLVRPPSVKTDPLIISQQQQQQQSSSLPPPRPNNALSTTLRVLQASKQFSKLNHHQQNNNASSQNNNSGIIQNSPTSHHQPITFNSQNAQPTSTSTATCLSGNNCTLPPLPRYPPKQSMGHRIPLNADSYRQGIHNSVEKQKTYASTHHHHHHQPQQNYGLKSMKKTVNNNSNPKTATGQRHHHHLGGGELCRRCHKPVYWAEMKLGYHGVYHVECFCCCCCGKPLESTTVSENQGEIFCTGCYRRFFGTHGIGFGIGAGVLQTP